MNAVYVKRALAITAIGVLSACGGGGTTSPAIPSHGSSADAKAKATFVIKVPPKANASSSKRPAFLPASVKGVVISAQQQNGPLGASNFFPLNPQQTYCTGGGTQALVCTLDVSAPPGTDVFTVQTYDSSSQYAGSLISSGTFTTTISAGASNTISIATGGVAATLLAAVDNPDPATGAASSQPVRAVAADVDGDIIVGSYDAPISVVSSNPEFTVSPASVASSTDLANLSETYNGTGTTAATLTLTSTSANSSYNGGTPLSASVALAPGVNGLRLSPSLLVFPTHSSTAQSVTVSGGTPPYSISVPCLYASSSGASPAFTFTPSGTNGSCAATIQDSGTTPLTTQLQVFVGP